MIEATVKLVLPGGIEAHCHIAQECGMGLMTADDYESGSISAAWRAERQNHPMPMTQENIRHINPMARPWVRRGGAATWPSSAIRFTLLPVPG